MLGGVTATRYSETAHSIPYKGARPNFRMRFNDGAWKQPASYPWDNDLLAGTTVLRDTEGQYPREAIVLNDELGAYGELDGIRHVSGFNNAVENTMLDSDGTTWVIIQDVYRTSFVDYYAMRLDS
ncbi:hypothetical protein D3C78_1560470 [compost metagenome]